MSALRVLAVDDNPIALRSVSRLLTSMPGVEVIGEANSAPEALELVKRLGPDLIVMDITMPEMDGFEATRVLARQQVRPIVILTTVHDLPIYANAARDAGADAFLVKSDLVDQLAPLIKDAVKKRNEAKTP